VSLWLVLLSAGVGAACQHLTAAVYVGAQPSREALIEAAVRAFRHRDIAALERLAVTEAEFRKYIWPALPASHRDVGMPVDYAWSELQFKSRLELGQTMREFGGKDFTVVAVRLAGASIPYRGFTIHADPEFTLRDSDGRRERVRLVGSLIETPSGWKIYSFVVD
jgi:hypothetical protein